MFIRPSIVAAAEQRKPAATTVQQRPPRSSMAAAWRRSPDGTPQIPATDATLIRRATNLAFAGTKPSATELERLMGSNDLVDEFYLQRALVAARPVMRITLRDPGGRERGWATGFMVSPRLLLTNWHVFPTLEDTQAAVVEAHYVLDIAGNPAPSCRFAVRGDVFYLSHQQLDFALVAIDQKAQDGTTELGQFGYHRLIADPHKIREGEPITLIQHPGGERRQLAIRENLLVKILDQFLWYQSDTAPGSSGAPAFNDSFQVVALHHSGAARRDEAGRYVLRDGSTVASLDGIDDSLVDWEANEGLRISVLCAYLQDHLAADQPLARELLQAMEGGDVMSQAMGGGLPASPWSSQPNPAAPTVLNGNVLTLPLQVQIAVSVGTAWAVPGLPANQPLPSSSAPPPPLAVEALRYPTVDRDYTTRQGYDPTFLGVTAPLPSVADPSLVSQMADGRHDIPYEHFSVVLHKSRRLCLFTACNIDYTASKRRPEPGDYSRRGLTGLGPHDQEKWLTDPRLPQQDQLPDVFYTKDGGSFDKGHVVRREDMCWGDSYAQIVRANGDTFHVTNCTPQVLGFNRSTSGDTNWGDLENEIRKQAKTEQLSLLAGPILTLDDRFFAGRDDFGPVDIQIPREYWKVVLANDNGQLAAYAFILQQELQDIPEEFRVTATWKPYWVSLAALESRLSGFSFAPELHAADRFDSGAPEAARAIGVEVLRL